MTKHSRAVAVYASVGTGVLVPYGIALAMGRLTLGLAGLLVFALGVMSFLDNERFSRFAIAAYLCAPFLMVVKPLHPEGFNYTAYSVVLLTLGAIPFAGRVLRSRVNATGAFVLLLVLSGAVSTLLFEPVPTYGLLVMPLGAASAYMLGIHRAGAVRPVLSRGLVIMAAAQATVGIAQTFTGWPNFGVEYSEPRNYLSLVIPSLPATVRMATGTFAHFNGLASLLSLVFPLALWNAVTRPSRGRVGLCLLLSAGAVCTFSRGAVIGIVVSLAALMAITARSPGQRVLRGLVAAVSVSAAGLALGESIAAYIKATSNLASRTAAWSVALGEGLSPTWSVVLGRGFGFLGLGFLEQHGVVSRAHSWVVQTAVELGLLGVLLLTMGLFGSVAAGLRNRAGHDAAMALSVASFSVHQLFDNMLYGYVGVLMFAMLGILDSGGFQARTNVRNVRRMPESTLVARELSHQGYSPAYSTAPGSSDLPRSRDFVE